MACCQLELKGKLSGEAEVKSSPTALFHLYATRPHHFHNIFPSIVHSCHVEHGEFGKNGSVIVWKYNTGGKFHVTKEVLENVDMENNSMTFRCVEGDIMDAYKTFVIHLHVGCNLLRFTFEYEKVNKDVETPTILLGTLLDVARQADAHLLSNPTLN